MKRLQTRLVCYATVPVYGTKRARDCKSVTIEKANTLDGRNDRKGERNDVDEKRGGRTHVASLNTRNLITRVSSSRAMGRITVVSLRHV